MHKYNIIHQLIETKFAHWPGTYPAIAQSKISSMWKLHPKLIAWIYVFKVPTKWNREVWTSRNIKHSLQQILGEKKRISAWSIVEAKSSNARKGTGTVPVRRCFLGTSASSWASVPSQSEEPILACATLCGMPLSFSHGYWSKLGTPTCSYFMIHTKGCGAETCLFTHNFDRMSTILSFWGLLYTRAWYLHPTQAHRSGFMVLPGLWIVSGDLPPLRPGDSSAADIGWCGWRGGDRIRMNMSLIWGWIKTC